MSWELSTFLTGASTPELGNVSNGEIPHAVLTADRDRKISSHSNPQAKEEGKNNTQEDYCYPFDSRLQEQLWSLVFPI